VYGETDSAGGYAGYFVGGQNYFEGLVGLGTASPTHRLELTMHTTPAGGIAFGTDVELFRSASNTLSLASGDSLSLSGGSYNVSGGSYSVGGQTVISLSRTLLAADGSPAVPGYGFASGGGSGIGMFKPAADNLAFVTNGLERMRINQSGSLGIGTTAPAFMLHVNGTAGKPGGGSWSVASDARLKRNVNDLDGALGSLLALRGVTFEYTDPDAINERPGEQIGMIAQEVECIFPQWVEIGSDGYRRLSIKGFEALAVEALRELRAEKDAEITALQQENDDLRQRLEAMEMAVNALAQHD
jgi:hypothetical protein